MSEKNPREENKITLSAIFMATYLTVIFGFDRSKLLFTGLLPDSFSVVLNEIVSFLFVFSGIFIVGIFFLYLVFSALSFTTNKERTLFFVKISEHAYQKRLESAKKKLFDFGVRLIFFSFYYLSFNLFGVSFIKYGFLKGAVVLLVSIFIVCVLLHFLFKDEEKLSN